MRHSWAYHALFAVGLLALTALTGWWFIFFQRTVDAQRASQLGELRSGAAVMAFRIGHGLVPPTLGEIRGAALPLEVVPSAEHGDDPSFSQAAPAHPEVGVRAAPAAVEQIESRARRRWRMVVGEGGFLFILISLCSFMLYRLVSQERRHRTRLETFISTVTHEMKTPLAGIKSLLQTLVAGRVPAEQTLPLYALGLKETERLEHVIENVLLSGRLRVDAHQIQLGPVELRGLLDRFVTHRRRYLVERPEAIDLAWEITGDAAHVEADADALLAILENLADNAFKYGGESPQVLLRVRRDGQRLAIAVEDDGIGFEPTGAEQLFLPFNRGAGGKRTVQHGTGLGLAIARTLARKMGGDLTACSEGPDRGSSFTITLREAHV